MPQSLPFQWDPDDYARNSQGQARLGQELLGQLRLKPDDAVLDIGCGDGKISADIAARLPAGRVVGIDSSAQMVRYATEIHAARLTGRFRALQKDAAALDFEQEFTVVFSNACLHWVADQRAVLAGIFRALRPAGRLVAQLGGHGNARQLIQTIDEVGAQGRWREYFANPVNAYCFPTAVEYRAWLLQAGLIPIQVELLQRSMVHDTPLALAGWLRTAWHPYVARVAEDVRTEFITEVVDAYLKQYGWDSNGNIQVPMVRLQVQARKPALLELAQPVGH